MAYSPLQCGLLTGKVTKSWINELPQGDWRRDNKYFKEPELSKNLEKIKKARLILEKSNLDFENPLMAASLQWVLRQSGVTSAIVGFRNTLQVEQVLNCLRTDLSQEILSEIGSIFR